MVLPRQETVGSELISSADIDFSVHDCWDRTALKLEPSGNTFNVVDYFTPFDQQLKG
jgi:hypothetical protein